MQRVKDLYEKYLADKSFTQKKDIICKIDKYEECNISKILTDNFQLDIYNNTILSSSIYQDIEFWNSVFGHINKTNLHGSKYFLEGLLKSPTHDVDILTKRQELLKNFECDEFSKLKENEQIVLHMYEDLDENMRDLYNVVYFKFNFLKKLNNNPETLSVYNLYRILVSPLVGILSPIIYFVIPYLVIIYKFGIDISFFSYLKIMYQTMTKSTEFMLGFGGNSYKTIQSVSYLLSMIFYFTGLFNSFDISRTLYKLTKHLTEKMNKISTFLIDSMDLIGKHWKEGMGDMFGVKVLDTQSELSYVQKLPIKKFNIISNFGRQLTAFKNINLDIITSVLKKIYILDSLNSLVLYKQEYDFGYTEYVNNNKPFMNLINIRHPSIENCIGNNIKLENNIIITGTNAGGKSVTIKSMLINALMSQTCTISCCDFCFMTPFSTITAQINVPDMTGHESLFEAELFRCKRNLDLLRDLDKDQKSLIIMDEIFSSTNPLEAISGAYAVCKKMSTFDNNLLIFTTHFNYLTKLNKTGKFINYKMDTRVAEDDINFTYKLVKGINKHFLALELLKKNGFDPEIIEEALEIKKRLT
jgi:hypothetical protein